MLAEDIADPAGPVGIGRDGRDDADDGESPEQVLRKWKILEIFRATMAACHHGSAQLARDLGIRPGYLVNDQTGHRAGRGLLASTMPWVRGGSRKT